MILFYAILNLVGPLVFARNGSCFTIVILLQVHVHIKRHVMNELPETDEAVAQWCKDIFVAKVVTI